MNLAWASGGRRSTTTAARRLFCHYVRDPKSFCLLAALHDPDEIIEHLFPGAFREFGHSHLLLIYTTALARACLERPSASSGYDDGDEDKVTVYVPLLDEGVDV